MQMSMRAARDNESIVASDLRHALLLGNGDAPAGGRAGCAQGAKRGGAGTMSHYKPTAEQPETRSQRRIYDQGTGLEERYVYTVRSAPGCALRRAWHEELRSKHGN